MRKTSSTPNEQATAFLNVRLVDPASGVGQTFIVSTQNLLTSCERVVATPHSPSIGLFLRDQSANTRCGIQLTRPDEMQR